MIPIDKNELYERLDKDKKEILEKLELLKSNIELLLKKPNKSKE